MTRQRMHRWLRRYGCNGLAGFADHSSRPGSCPHQMPPEIEARLITLRVEHPEWGAQTLRHELKAVSCGRVDPVPLHRWP